MDELVEIRLRMRNTFSFWATVIGATLAVPKQTRRAGALLLLLVGYGGVGVAWERAYQCDLRRVRSARPPTRILTGVLSHAPLAIVGHLLLHQHRQQRCFRKQHMDQGCCSTHTDVAHHSDAVLSTN